MTFLQDYFEKVFVINCAHRPDRRKHISDLLGFHGIRFEFFDAHTGVVVDGKVNGNAGCTASHRALLELCAHHRWRSMFVFEDDADIIYRDFHERFDRFIQEVPADWGMIYLGGGYGEAPICRVSKHVLQVGRMMTTSSYGITWQQARKMAPYISGVGPIDSLYGGFNLEAPTYCITPRCVVQLPSVSDLQDRHMDNSQSMLDCALESSL